MDELVSQARPSQPQRGCIVSKEGCSQILAHGTVNPIHLTFTLVSPTVENYQEYVIDLAMLSSFLQLILATEGALKSWLGRPREEEEEEVCHVCTNLLMHVSPTQLTLTLTHTAHTTHTTQPSSKLLIRNAGLTKTVNREERANHTFTLKVFLSRWEGSLVKRAVEQSKQLDY